MLLALSVCLSLVLARDGGVLAQSLQVPTTPAVPPGSTTQLVVVIHQAGQSCSSFQGFIAYDSINTPVAAKADGSPDCTAVSAVTANKTAGFTFWPQGCSGTGCKQVRAYIFDQQTTSPQIAVNDTIFFTCLVTVSPAAPNGSYPFVFTDVRAGGSTGNAFTGVTGTDGAIVVDSSATPPHC